MTKKNMTINDLAGMVQRNFNNIEGKVDGLQKEVSELNTKVGRIEKLILDDHRERIEKLESKMLYLENMLSLPKK